MSEHKSTLETINEFAAISELMNDPDLDAALALVVKLMAQPDLATVKTPQLIIKLQALAAKFDMLASYYANVDKSNRARKNLYFSAGKVANDLAAAVKYSMRG